MKGFKQCELFSKTNCGLTRAALSTRGAQKQIPISLISVFLVMSVSQPLAQLSKDQIAALQDQGKKEGWMFTVNENSATRRPLSALCGLVEPPNWRATARFVRAATRAKQDGPEGPEPGPLPSSFDWRTQGGCTPIKDQDGCGSCWAFATVGPFESAIKIKDGTEVDLSEQWLVSCNNNRWSCGGGWFAHEYHSGEATDACGDSGAVLESSFPYRAANLSCACPYSHEYLLASWAYIGSEDTIPSVEEIKQAIMDYGPVSVAVYASPSFQAYSGGIYNACPSSSINHGVVLVGWDDNQGEGVWFLRNSWGTDWGESGYMRIAYNCSRVGYAACFVCYEGRDSLLVRPYGGVSLAGVKGGPFRPASATYSLTNCGPAPLAWRATPSATWLEVSPSTGILGVGASTNVSVLLGADAAALLEGTYAGVVGFTNLTSGRGVARKVSLEVYTRLYWFPLNTDAGWAREGEWAFGRPTGSGGTKYGHPDPTGGASGTNVFGVNLSGDVANASGPWYYLTAGPLDLTDCSHTKLGFQRWLNVNRSSEAAVQVSANGTNWTTVWSKKGYTTGIADSCWTNQLYDISAVADDERSVYIRWGYRTWSSITPCSGWNVDDVEILSGRAIIGKGAVVVAEGCTPGNGAPDPGETVTISFRLRNLGANSISNLIATLQPTGGVVPLCGPQSYGLLLSHGSEVARPFVFNANGPCGGTLVATLQLQEGLVNWGTVAFTFSLGRGFTVLSEDFDGRPGPSLPAGWTTVASGDMYPWVITTNKFGLALPATRPNMAYSSGNYPINEAGENALVSPKVNITSPSATLSFRQVRPTYSGNGGVLEVQIGDAPFADVIDAGGTFISGEYDAVIPATYGNPLGGRPGWTEGTGGSFATTSIALPPAVAGQDIQLRWRFGRGSNWSEFLSWAVDSISISDSYECCTSPADLSLSMTGPGNAVTAGDTFPCIITVSNAGPSWATSVTVNNPLPPGLVALSAIPSQGFCTTNGTAVTCNLGVLSTGSTASVVMTVLPTACGIITNVAIVTAGQFDPDPLNNIASLLTFVPADADGDQMPDAWEVAHGLNSHNPLDAALDADGDGLSNLQEYLAGTDPRVAGDRFCITAASRVGQALRLTFCSVLGDEYVLEGRTNLTLGAWNELLPGIVGTGGLQSVTAAADVLSSPRQYFRLRLELDRPPANASPAIEWLTPAQSAAVGGAMTLQAWASGTTPVSFQWWCNGAPLWGATNASLNLTDLQLANAGDYAVVVSNRFGCITSLLTHVSVRLPPVLTSWVARYPKLGTGRNYPAGLEVDTSGNVYVTGSSRGLTSDYDYATVKYGPNGAALWTNRYNGPASHKDNASALGLDGNGNVYVTGQSWTGASYDSDWVTIKYSANGNGLWTNRYATSGGHTDYPNALAVDGTGAVYVTGRAYGAGTSPYDLVTVKYSAGGGSVWTNRFNGLGNGNDAGTAIAVTAAGDVCVAGCAWNNLNDFVALKYTTAGTVMWTNLYDGPLSMTDEASGVAFDSAGNVYVTGAAEISGFQDAIAALKYSASGTPLWTNLYLSPGYQEAFPTALEVDASGNVYVTGFSCYPWADASYPHQGFTTNFITIKYGGDGRGGWTNRYDNPEHRQDCARAMAIDSAGNVYVTGESVCNRTNASFVTLSYDPNGNLRWVTEYSGQANSTNYAKAIKVDGSGNVYVTGESEGDYLTIKYEQHPPEVLGQAPRLAVAILPALSAVQLTVLGNAGTTNRIEYAGRLPATNWQVLQTVIATNGCGVILDQCLPGTKARFYRAVKLQ